MGKFDIKKATGRYKKAESVEKREARTVSPQQEFAPEVNVTTQISKTDDLAKALSLFDTIVSHNYLTKLSNYPIVLPAPTPSSEMGWYRITRIVHDGNTFFPDQLSMLYIALHNIAKNVALVIDKKGLDDIEIYLGARDFDGYRHEASTLLGSAIQGFLPGINAEPSDKIFCVNQKDGFVATYCGIATLRDEKKESFVQGIEKFIDATPAIPTFTAMFIADNVNQQETNDIINAYHSLLDVIRPFNQFQETFNASETEGVSQTLTKTLGDTITNTISKTVTNTRGTNRSKSIGTSYNESYSENESESSSLILLGEQTGFTKTETVGYQKNIQIGSHEDRSLANAVSVSSAQQTSNAESYSDQSSKTTGHSLQITRTNSVTNHFSDILERHIERLQNGKPFGLWSIGTYFVSPNASTSRKLASIYRGCVTGENSDLDVTAVNVWGKDDSVSLLSYLRNCQNPRFKIEDIDVPGTEIVTSKELAIHMSLPQTAIPGVEVRECASFGRNLDGKKSTQATDSGYINLGDITHLGKTSKKKVCLDIKELNQHMFITGSTGSGKSNTVYLIIDKLIEQGKKVLIIEPTKGDYRKVFGGKADMTVYSTRENEKNLLKINPFAFPDGIQVNEHVERLVEIFGVCWPMYAAMPAVLKKSIISAYIGCGWDIRKSTCRHGKLFPTISDVVVQLKKIIASSEYSADTKGDYIGALQTRLESLQDGIYSSILSSSECIDYNKLYDQNAIIDLHHIGSTETRSLLMAMLVLGLNEWRMSTHEDDMDLPLQHITVIEEAHNILPRVSKHQNQEGSNVLGKSVEMIADVMSRIRTYGEGFIIVDQSPSAIDESAIRNTNTKIVMNLPDGEDCIIAGRAISLTKDNQISELSRLATGEAVVWQRGWSEAVLTHVDEMSKRNPLKSCDNASSIIDSQRISPSNLFLKRFLKDEPLSEKEKASLQTEILGAMLPSSIKSTLLDILNNTTLQKETILMDSVVRYLGLDVEIVRLFEEYGFAGSSQLTKDLRDFIAGTLSIFDTELQNLLLSMVFIWASSQNAKWHKICSRSVPSNKKNN